MTRKAIGARYLIILVRLYETSGPCIMALYALAVAIVGEVIGVVRGMWVMAAAASFRSRLVGGLFFKRVLSVAQETEPVSRGPCQPL